jgi:hypothetical protein
MWPTVIWKARLAPASIRSDASALPPIRRGDNRSPQCRFSSPYATRSCASTRAVATVARNETAAERTGED